jgi:hypothetical protein
MHLRFNTPPVAGLVVAGLVSVSVIFAPSANAQDGGVYQELGGIVVVEIESTPASSGWAYETSLSGYTFQGYYRWNGGDQFNNPGLGILPFRVNLLQSGEYFLALRNRHDDPDDTEENDTWLRVDGGAWLKLFSNGPGTVGVWNWDSRLDIAGQPQASFNLGAGEHLIEFSGRSQNFKMDRFHMYLQGHPDANDETVAESTALLGAEYCGPAVPNSSGNSAVIEAWGSTFVVNNDVQLAAQGMAQNQFGYFIVSNTQGFVAGPGISQGNLCLGGSIGRYSNTVQNTGAAGKFTLTIDLNNIPTPPPVAVMPGETWSFQAWFRDNNPGQTSNFTAGRSVVFQ